MGGNGGAPRGGIASPVRQAAEQQISFGEQLRGAGQPAQDEGLEQFLNLLSTGGVGARVPIISRAVAGQQGATRRAQEGIAQAGARGGVDQNIINRLMSQIGTEGSARATGIGPQVAGSLALSNILNSLRGGAAGGNVIGRGISGAAQGFRTATPSRAAQSLGSNLANLAGFAGAGGFNDVGSLFSSPGFSGGAAAAPIGGVGSQFPTLTAG